MCRAVVRLIASSNRDVRTVLFPQEARHKLTPEVDIDDACATCASKGVDEFRKHLKSPAFVVLPRSSVLICASTAAACPTFSELGILLKDASKQLSTQL